MDQPWLDAGLNRLAAVLDHVPSWLVWLSAGVLLANMLSLPFMFHVRLAWTVVRSVLVDGPLREDSTTDTRHRVTIDDLDINLHMNNSSYNKLADFNRWTYVVRMLLRRQLYFKYRVMNGGVFMLFQREMRPWQAYQIRTRVAGWNQKWIALVHIWSSGHQRMALGATKMVVKHPSGKTVHPEEFFAAIGWDVERLRAHSSQWSNVVSSILEFEEILAAAAHDVQAHVPRSH